MDGRVSARCPRGPELAPVEEIAKVAVEVEMFNPLESEDESEGHSLSLALVAPVLGPVTIIALGVVRAR